MTREEFKQMLTETYGHRPFYYRTDKEVRQMIGKTPAALANDDCMGRGLKPFYIGRKAAYVTPELIDKAVERFNPERNS